MANEVYANGREIACKSGSGKVIAAFPDVCFTPPDKVPPTPPGVPIPYPVTSMASDTSKGTKKVKISNKEVMKRDSSNFKKCMGDEAAQTAKKGIINSKLSGKVFFNSWSMDVKVEGKNVVRHLDTTTSNHSSPLANVAPPWIYQDMPASLEEKCAAQHEAAENDCQGATPHMTTTPQGNVKQTGLDCPPGCAEARACILVAKKGDDEFCCHPDTTGHHLVPVHCFVHPSGRGEALDRGYRLDEYLDYRDNDAPTVCAGDKADPLSTHARMHDVQDSMERGYRNLRMADPDFEPHSFGGHPNDESYWDYGEARDAGVAAHSRVFPHCEPECTRAQLDHYHKTKLGLDDSAPMRTNP
jgi:hypothetical protein